MVNDMSTSETPEPLPSDDADATEVPDGQAVVGDEAPPEEDLPADLAVKTTTCAVVGALVTLAFELFNRRSWPVYGEDLQLFVPFLVVWVACVPVVALLMRERLDWRKPDRRDWRHTFVGTLIALFVILNNGAPYCRAANAWFDSSTPRSVEARIVDTREVFASKAPTFYYLKVQPGGDLPEGEISVDYQLFSAVQKGNTVGFTLRQGNLGWPWAEDVELVPR